MQVYQLVGMAYNYNTVQGFQSLDLARPSTMQQCLLLSSYFFGVHGGNYKLYAVSSFRGSAKAAIDRSQNQEGHAKHIIHRIWFPTFKVMLN